MTINFKKIIVARLKNGMSRKELASKSGTSIWVVSNFERGKTVPKPKTLKKICEELNLKVEEIISI